MLYIVLLINAMKVFVYLSCLLVSVNAVSCSESSNRLSVDKKTGIAVTGIATLHPNSKDNIPSIDKDASC